MEAIVESEPLDALSERGVRAGVVAVLSVRGRRWRPTTVAVTALPSPVAFRGMPNDRFWQFEDARVSWDAVTMDSAAVATALLLEFALISSPDSFVVPHRT